MIVTETKRDTGHTDVVSTDGQRVCVMRKSREGLLAREVWFGSVADMTRELLPLKWGVSRAP